MAHENQGDNMYTFKSAHTDSDTTGPYIETLHSINANSSLHVVIEAIDFDIKSLGSDFLAYFLAKSVGCTFWQPTSQSLPVDIAASIKDELQKHAESGNRRFAVMYAGVFMRQNEIQVCTAVDIRVHLLQKHKLISRTRDHNLIEDAPAESAHRERNLPEEFLSGVTTRTINTEDSFPETCQWSIDGEYTVLICTSQYHRYRDSKEYLSMPIDKIIKDKSRTLSPAYGASWFVAEISRIIA